MHLQVIKKTHHPREYCANNMEEQLTGKIQIVRPETIKTLEEHKLFNK